MSNTIRSPQRSEFEAKIKSDALGTDQTYRLNEQVYKDIAADLSSSHGDLPTRVAADNALLESIGLGGFQIVGISEQGHIITETDGLIRDGGTIDKPELPNLELAGLLVAQTENFSHERVHFHDLGKPGDETHILYGGTKRTITRGADGSVTQVSDIGPDGKTQVQLIQATNNPGEYKLTDAEGNSQIITDFHITDDGALTWRGPDGTYYQHYDRADGKAHTDMVLDKDDRPIGASSMASSQKPPEQPMQSPPDQPPQSSPPESPPQSPTQPAVSEPGDLGNGVHAIISANGEQFWSNLDPSNGDWAAVFYEPGRSGGPGKRIIVHADGTQTQESVPGPSEQPQPQAQPTGVTRFWSPPQIYW